MPAHEETFQRLEGGDAVGAARPRRATERLDSARPELRPRGVGEILDAGLDALRARFAPCVGLCLVLWAGPAALLAWLPPERWGPEGGAANDPAVLISQLIGVMVNTLITALVQGFATMVVALVVRGEFAGEPMALSEALRVVLRRMLPILATVVLILLISIAGMVACILPYFFFLWRLSAAPLACASEGLGPGASLARSFWLTKGSFLRWLGVTVVSGVLLLPLSAFASIAGHADVRDQLLENLALPAATYDAILWLAATLFLGVATAAGGAFTAAYYYDCRVRREALDLRERLRATGAVGAAAEGPA